MKILYLRNVVSLRLDPETCIGCGRCIEVCPHGVFAMGDGKSRIAERDACMECGACARNCPVDALYVKNGVGCAVGILNAAMGRTSGCCGEKQSCCCSESKSESATPERRERQRKE
jgi:NAD-dependent dihydropyrimidine dehydrogenase PreA subunit